MCTLVILRRPEHRWPLLIAANRDEMANRPWKPPGRHWPDRPDVVAGLDELAGGSWLGLNDAGVVAGILNRVGSLGPAPGLRSRGELVLEALDHADALAAASALSHLDPRAWRPFNMLVADDRDAFWIMSLGGEGPRDIAVAPVPDGLSMLTARDLDDLASPRIRHYRPRFLAAPVPDPDAGDWRAWIALLGGREAGPGSGEEGAMTIARADGFGTSSAALIALPAADVAEPRRPIWRFAAGAPDRAEFLDVTL